MGNLDHSTVLPPAKRFSLCEHVVDSSSSKKSKDAGSVHQAKSVVTPQIGGEPGQEKDKSAEEEKEACLALAETMKGGETCDLIVQLHPAEYRSLCEPVVDSLSSKKSKDAGSVDADVHVGHQAKSVITTQSGGEPKQERKKSPEEEKEDVRACRDALSAGEAAIDVALVAKHAPAYMASRSKWRKFGPIPPPLADPEVWDNTDCTMSAAQMREAKKGLPLFLGHEALQVLSVRLVYATPELVDAQGFVRISGSIRARDATDPDRNYLLNIPDKEYTRIKLGEPILLSGPCRGITTDIAAETMLEFELTAEPVKGGDPVQLIADVCSTEGDMGRFFSRVAHSEAFGKHGIAQVYYTCFSDAAEAYLEVCSTGSGSEAAGIVKFRIVARYAMEPSGHCKEREIVLLDDDDLRSKRRLPVVVVPRHGVLEVEVQPEGYPPVSRLFPPRVRHSSVPWKVDLPGCGGSIDATLHWCSMEWVNPYAERSVIRSAEWHEVYGLRYGPLEVEV